MSAAYPRSSEPMMEINTTPLIDVMLVLIIMLIITIPLQSHSVKLDLPGGGVTAVDPARNRVEIAEDGSLLWNGQSVGRAELRARLIATTTLPSAPELHLQPAALAHYGIVDEVLVMAKQASVTRIGSVGNEAYAQF